jgi:hypothetical protein
MINTIQIKRGTRAQIEAAKAAGQLKDGEPYLITDENRIAVGVDSSGYSAFVKDTEVIQIDHGGTGGTTPSEARTNLELGILTGDLTGFLTRTTSSIAFDNTTRVLSLVINSPTFIYHKGVQFTLTSTKTVTVSNVSGGRYIYFDPATEELMEGSQNGDIRDALLVAYIYWSTEDQRASIVGDERHSVTRDTEWHYNQHRNVGAVWRSGGEPTYSLSNPANVSIGFATPIEIADEDLEHHISHTSDSSIPYGQLLNIGAYLPVWYLNGLNYREILPTSDQPWVPGISRARYNPIVNGQGSLQDAGNGNYIAYWIIATNDQNNPIKALMGKQVHTNAAAAVSETFAQYDLPIPELVPMYKVVLRVGSYANLAGVIIASVTSISTNQSLAFNTFNLVSHTTLKDRELTDQHPIAAVTNLQSTLDSKINIDDNIDCGLF